MTDPLALNAAKVHIEKALEDLEAAANDDSNDFVQDSPRIYTAAEELRAAKRKITEHELELEERQ